MTATPTAPSPVYVRVARGDLVDVHASLVAVSHVNDVAPTGAERAVDELLGGAITRRAASLRGRWGTTHFLPTVASPLAAGSVLVVCLGDAEDFSVDRLAETGAAIVDAAATIGVRDVATVVHGGGTGEIDVRKAACRLLNGVLRAIHQVDGGSVLRELTIVERDPARFDQVLAGVQDAVTIPSVHVYVSELEVRRTITPAPAPSATPPHLRLGVTRSGRDLKVTRIGDDAFDRARVVPYPEEVSRHLTENLRAQALDEGDVNARGQQLVSIGRQLYEAFLGDAGLGADQLIDQAPGGLVVLRLDGHTVDLPWELMRLPDGRAVSLERSLARQLELGSIGRAAAFNTPNERLCALVIGDPTGDLAGAGREAEAVADCLQERAGADVKRLIGGVSYADVSRELDSRSYDVLHYAGHAEFVEGRSDDSGLRLSDALLTPSDLATRRYVPRLIVANACHAADTGSPYTGSAETRTLVSGFLGAGARAFVGAMWEVDDGAATTFSAAFYEAVAPVGTGPQPVGEAVRAGRRAIVDLFPEGEGEPAWAAYALYGSPWRTAI